MHPSKEKTLIETYPSFFHKDFSFECDDGWYDLIGRLCYDITKVLTKEEAKVFKILQVKEKFATLRVYCENSNDAVFQLIQKASEASASICEITGGVGQLHKSGGYLKTLNKDTAKLIKFKPVKE